MEEVEVAEEEDRDLVDLVVALVESPVVPPAFL